ncbi:MAG: hypothetical protein GC136_05860 [Alphaproteobacteria bacterium]|nr:hypothetical protein [Alphaproteobacteria bacterium]
MIKKTFMEVVYPALGHREDVYRLEVPSRDINEVKIPHLDEVISIRFFDQAHYTVDGKQFAEDPENIGPRIFFGDVLTRDELAADTQGFEAQRHRTVEFMDNHNISHAVRSRKEYRPILHEDQVYSREKQQIWPKPA